jgi:polyisoprenoid-binding protein YceI
MASLHPALASPLRHLSRGLPMPRWWLAALALLLIAPAARAQVSLLPAASEISFVSRQMGAPLEGRFRRFEAEVAIDPQRLAAASVRLGIDLGSVALGAGLADIEAELRQPAWFDTRQFAQASFTSSAVKPLGGGRLEVAGRLSLKGRSVPLTVAVTLSQAAGVTTASGSFALKRLDFKVGDGDWADTGIVANEVQVRFKLALKGVGPL